MAKRSAEEDAGAPPAPPAPPAPAPAAGEPTAEPTIPAPPETPVEQPTTPDSTPAPAAAADDDAEYLVGVIRKQARLDTDAARKVAGSLPKEIASQVVALGRVGRVAELRALLKLD